MFYDVLVDWTDNNELRLFSLEVSCYLVALCVCVFDIL